MILALIIEHSGALALLATCGGYVFAAYRRWSWETTPEWEDDEDND